MLVHPGFDQAPNAEASFLECARELQDMFRDYSDRQFLLLDPEVRASVTLVTVCLTPISATPKVDTGLDLFCEFHQVTQFGAVSTEGFEVYSETGEYPILAPSPMDLLMMMKSTGQIGL
jgi:hypothetical protein